MHFGRPRRVVAGLSLALTLGLGTAHAVNVNGRIKGTVTDPTGAVVPGVVVVAINQATGVKTPTTTGTDGMYIFPQLPIGTYSIMVNTAGFQGFKATGIVLNIDQEYVEPVVLNVGQSTETLEVAADAVQVNTTDMQINNIVNSRQITELPLIGRGFTGLELILPGVQASNDRFGSFSVNGSQSQQSSYIINGADSNDLPLNTVAINPNIDALQQFNLVTGPLNAEYDRNSGAVVNTAIIEGTNQFHGDVFEFYRDTFLNTRNYFQKTSPTPKYHQNIFGGTIGGPILKDRFFFFGAYQGTRQGVPEAGGNVNVFTPAQLAGDFSSSSITNNVIPATINIPGCVAGTETFAQCFKGGQVPTTAFNTISSALVKQFVPLPNAGSNSYTFNPTVSTSSDQGIGRFDFNPTSRDQIYFVGIYQKTLTSEALPFTGATLPGFGDMNTTVIHQFSAGYTRQLSSTAVNDLQVHYTRFNFDAVEPQHVVQPSTFGFAITPQNAAAASLPTISISNYFTLGFSTNGPQPRLDQVYQVDDTFSKTFGEHNLKFGFDGRRYNVANPFYNNNNGSFSFSTSSNNDTTGDAGLDFLLGIPSTYRQGSGARIDAYAFLDYFFAQDTWKATKDLTISYGVGYQIDTPLHNLQYGGIGVTCFIPGQQSTVFPSAPRGLDYPGDRGCNNASGATTFYKDVGPRIGFAWAPDLGFISSGSSKKFSLRAGYGIYYNRSEEETSLNNLGDPPFGQTSTGAPDYGQATNPSFANPYQDLNVTGSAGLTKNKFPFTPPTAGSSPDFSVFLPFQLSQYNVGFRSPYSENFQLTVEREFPSQLVARASYIGTLGRHNQIVVEGNPITQAGHDACLASTACSTTYRNVQNFYYPNHTAYGQADTTNFGGRGPSGVGYNDFSTIGLITTEGSSNYNSLQLSIDKGLTHGLQFQASYTLAHSLDDASSYEGSGYGVGRGYNQFNKALNYGNSSFDARHRFVFAPVYVVPFKKTSNQFSPVNLLLSGWEITGIATFATGFPFDISYAGGSSRSLYCSSSVSYYACPDVPLQTAPLVRVDPRTHFVTSKGKVANRVVYFQPTSFAPEPLGAFGNISRYKYHGPGINNTNLILAKNFSLSRDGSRYLQLRMESDNVFNHTQFSLPTSNISGTTFSATNQVTNSDTQTFGQITSAAAGRQTQLAAKIYF